MKFPEKYPEGHNFNAGSFPSTSPYRSRGCWAVLGDLSLGQAQEKTEPHQSPCSAASSVCFQSDSLKYLNTSKALGKGGGSPAPQLRK